MRTLIFICFLVSFAYAQSPLIEPGVSHELAKWRAAHYSDVRYKLNLTLEKMSPVLKGTMEVRVVLRDAGSGGRGDAVTPGSPPSEGGVDTALGGRGGSFIVLDWRKIRGHEEKSTISNVSINGKELKNHPVGEAPTPLLRKEGSPERPLVFSEHNEHLIFHDGVIAGENVIKLDFTSPILTSGSAITRYVDKEDGAEYIYSLFVPSDASTAFPVFDQPDLKARFTLSIKTPPDWAAIANNRSKRWANADVNGGITGENRSNGFSFSETKPISTYVFAFAAGPWQQVSEPGAVATGSPLDIETTKVDPVATAPGSDSRGHVFVRKSQLAKFQPHAAEVFRLNREGITFLEQYFDYKFPFPKYDIVLIPEFPFGGMEHAGATFLREDRVIFPQEPTKNDYITRANLIFHEAAHQWFGDTVTMRWFDDLWLKEGFAEFMAYKTLEKVMPEYNAWKVFYERNKQAAYLTDSTKGTTPIYQEIRNLSAAKSAYGNIVYRKAPSFLKQAEFYIGADKFQTAVRVFLKKREFGNAGWEDLVKEFEASSGKDLKDWAARWVTRRGMPAISFSYVVGTKAKGDEIIYQRQTGLVESVLREQSYQVLIFGKKGTRDVWTMQTSALSPVYQRHAMTEFDGEPLTKVSSNDVMFAFPNYQDYGYGIFLLDDESRDYVLKNIQNEKDDFLRSMMWGSLWDSVRESELDPKEYVELVLKSLSTTPSAEAAATPPIQEGSPKRPSEGGTQNPAEDETTVATLLNRVSTATTYYLSDKQRDAIAPRLEAMLIEKMQNAPTLGQRLTYYRALLNVASTENARGVLKRLLHETLPPAVAAGSTGGNPSGSEGANPKSKIENPKSGDTLPTGRVSASRTKLPLKTKDRFDIVTRLLILNDPDAPKLLTELEKSETSDEAKRYAYAARAGIATKENKAKYWSDFTTNKEISESWIEAAFGPFNSVRHADLTLPYLERALKELPNHKRDRKIFFVNGWLGAFIGGQRSEQALAIVNTFLADDPNLDRDLRLKILENVDLIERAVKIRRKFQ